MENSNLLNATNTTTGNEEGGGDLVTNVVFPIALIVITILAIVFCKNRDKREGVGVGQDSPEVRNESGDAGQNPSNRARSNSENPQAEPGTNVKATEGTSQDKGVQETLV